MYDTNLKVPRWRVDLLTYRGHPGMAMIEVQAAIDTREIRLGRLRFENLESRHLYPKR